MKKLMAMGLALSGLTIALSDKLFMISEHEVLFKGELIMLLAALVGAIYTIFARRVLQKVPASTMTPLAMLSGSIFLLPFAVNNGIDAHLLSLSSLQFGLLVYLGVFTGGIAFFLLNWTLNKSTATFTSLFVTLNPMTAIFLVTFFLEKALRPISLLVFWLCFPGLVSQCDHRFEPIRCESVF